MGNRIRASYTWQYVKRNILPRFYGISHACANSGAQAVFSLPRKKRPGNEASPAPSISARARRAGPAGALRHRMHCTAHKARSSSVQARWRLRVTSPLLAYCTIANAYTLLRKINETSVKIIKNEEGCRDDTMPKKIETRRHCEVD